MDRIRFSIIVDIFTDIRFKYEIPQHCKCCGADGATRAVEYIYDASGRLIEDKNRGVDLEYNILGLPRYVDDQNSGFSIRYMYDAAGNKLQKFRDDTNVCPPNSPCAGQDPYAIDYIGNFVYERGKLKMIYHPEGVIRPTPANADNESEFVYDYFIKDYLGNVRVVLTEENAVYTTKFLATLEEAYRAIEEENFDNVGETAEDLPSGYPVDGSVDLNEKIALLSSANGTEIGPSIVMPVKRGDKVSMRTDYFFTEDAPGTTYDNMNVLINEVLLALAASGSGVLQLSEAQLIDIAEGAGNYGNALGSFFSNNFDTTDVSKPHAYLVWMLYDNSMKLLPQGSGAKRVTNPNELKQLLEEDIPVVEDGYLHAYVSNGSAKGVSFDNFLLTYLRGNTRQINHYYPYGLSIDGLDHSDEYLNKYTSKELQTGEFIQYVTSGLEMFDFGSRFYDPQLGRWFVPDPAEQFHNPYLAMGNTPVNGYDPNGELFLIDDLIVGGIAAVGGYVYSGLTTKDWGWQSAKTGLIWGGTALLALNTGGLSLSPSAAAAFGGQFVASQVVGSFMPSINVPINDNLSVGISPAVFFGGGQTGFGINGNVNYSSGNFSASVGFGARSFSKNFGPSGFQQEFTSSWGAGWDDGKSGFGLYSTKFNSGSTSQRIGGVSASTTVEGERLGFRYENDGAPFHFLGSGYNDGGDRYRTVASQLSYGDFNIRMNLYTGDYKTGHVNPDNASSKYPNSYYEGGNVDAYRWGGLSGGYGNYNLGINSERVRHVFQNKFAHGFVKPQPAFKMLGRSIESVFQYRIDSQYTLW